MIEAARTLRRQDQKSGPGMQLLVLVFVATAAFVAPFVSWFLLTPKPQNIRIANLGAHSFSVAWTTTRPSTGCAVTSFLKGKDFSLKQSCSKQRRKAHFVEVEKLLPETDYSLYILGGIRLTKHKSVLTQKIRT